MPRVDNKGISIHYRVEGNGPPLVLGHGITDSSEFGMSGATLRH